MPDPESLGAAAAGLGVAGPLAAWVVRKLFRVLYRILLRFDTIGEKVDRIDERVKKIEPIVAEFKPNGGSSMRDAVNLLERRLTILAGQHRARFEGDALATYECDATGQCTYASAALAELYGMPAEQFMGTGWLRAVATATERERVWGTWQHAIRHQIPYEDIYTVLAHGKPLKVRTYTRAVKDAKGVPLCYFGVVVVPPPDSKLVGGGSTAASSSPPVAPVPLADTDEHTPLTDSPPKG